MGTSQHCYLDGTGAIVHMEKKNPAFLAVFQAECEGEKNKKQG